MKPNLLYVTKNDFDDGCGLTNPPTCAKLPACLSILGCDGFSIPTALLRRLFNANGYRFKLSYRQV